MFIKIASWTRECFRALSANFIWAIACVGLLPVIILINIWNASLVYRSYGTEISLADCFVFTSDILPVSLLFVPAMAFLLKQLFKQDFSCAFLLRQGNRRTLWMKQSYQIFLLSILWTMLVALWASLIGVCFSGTAINWGSEEGLFYLITGALRPHVSFFQVLLTFLLVLFFRLDIMCMLLQLLDWINRKVIGWALLILVGCTDWYYPRFAVFYRRIALNHEHWLDPSSFLFDFSYAVVLLLLIGFLGFKVSSGKEFFHG